MSHPGVVENLLDRKSLVWISLQNTFQQIKSFWTNSIWSLLVLRRALYDLLVEFTHVVSFKRNRAKEHRIENDARWPDIRAESHVSTVLKNFWCDVGRSSTLLIHDITTARNEFADSKVANFDVSRARKQDVVQLNVPVEYHLLVTVT